MKIIQDGNLDKIKETIRFACKRCGCVFEAEKTNIKGVRSTMKHTIYANARFVTTNVLKTSRFKKFTPKY